MVIKKRLLVIVPSKIVKKEQSERHIGHKFIGSNPGMHDFISAAVKTYLANCLADANLCAMKKSERKLN